jgi:hypothetical protein
MNANNKETTMGQEISARQASLWNDADRAGVAQMYRDGTRGQDLEVRAAFKHDMAITGTRAWAVCQCMSFRSMNFSDEDCDSIRAALGI